MDTHNGSTNNPPSSGGPAIAIILGVLIIIGAVVLVMTVGQNESATEPGEATAGPAETKAPEQPAEPAKTSESPAEELADLPVELPNPAFAGTPKQAPQGVRMKPLTGKDRGPYQLPAEIVPQLTNLAYEKPVTSSDMAPLIGDLEQVTDGDKEPLDGRWVELAPGKQWVQIDLEQEYENFAVIVWHNHLENNRVYRDVIVQVSNDPDFVDATTVFNNDYDNSSGLGEGQDFEYFENYEGLLVPLYNPQTKSGVKFRYVRCWSKGSTSDDANHYTEVEVWGREIK